MTTLELVTVIRKKGTRVILEVNGGTSYITLEKGKPVTIVQHETNVRYHTYVNSDVQYDYELCLTDAGEEKHGWISPCLLPKGHLGIHRHLELCKNAGCVCKP